MGIKCHCNYKENEVENLCALFLQLMLLGGWRPEEAVKVKVNVQVLDKVL
jgi:hypothetical protein